MGLGLEGVAGGIGQLCRLLSEHGRAVSRDLLCAGLHLRDLGTERLTWDELAAFVEHAPPTSALVAATDPDAWITPEVRMLREVDHKLDVLAWMKTEDAHKKPPRNFPQRRPLTKSEVQAFQDAQPPELHAVPIDELNEWLGWPARTSA